MAKEPTKTATEAAAPEPSRVETEVASPTTTSFEQGQDKAITSSDDGVSAEFNQDGINTKVGLGEDGGDVAEPDEDGAAEPEDGGEETPAPEEGDLPDFEPTEEVIAQYDAKYFREDGTLDIEGALSKEFWGSYDPADLSKAGLKESTYAYLKERLGLSKEQVKEVEAGQLARAEKQQEAFYKSVGGKQRFDTAVQWAQQGGYTKEQQDRFNAMTAKGGQDSMDAIDALMSRFDRARPPEQDRFNRFRGKPRRHSSPQRDHTGKAGVGGGSNTQADTFKTRQEYQEAMATARKTGDQKAMDAVRAKGRRSEFRG
jgi:hypothetical protein